jgi:hypothetical protein
MRSPFSPAFNFVVNHPITFAGRNYQPGEDFDKTNVEPRLLQMLWEQHKINSVIPSIVLKSDDGKRPAAAPPKAKAKAAKEEPQPDKAAAPRYRLESNFGSLKIMDGDTLVKECATPEEAKAAMAELSGS